MRSQKILWDLKNSLRPHIGYCIFCIVDSIDIVAIVDNIGNVDTIDNADIVGDVDIVNNIRIVGNAGIVQVCLNFYI